MSIVTTLILLAFLSNVSGVVKPRFHLSPALFSTSEITAMSGLGRSEEVLEPKLIDITDRLLGELANRGYPLATVDSVQVADSAGVQFIDLFIGLGGPLLTIEGEEHKILDLNRLERRASQLLDSLTNAGFPFARVSFRPGNLRFEGLGLGADLVTQIESGGFYRIAKVRFPGASAASEKTLRRESRLKSGEMFRREEVIKARERVNRTPRIVQADEPLLLKAAPGYLDIDIPVATRSGTRATGIASLTPGSDKPTGEVEIVVGELFGGSRSIEFGWYGLDPLRRGIKGNYTEEWIAGLPIGLNVEIEGWQVAGSHGRTTYRAGGVWEPFEDFSIGVGGAVERVAIQGDSIIGEGSRTNWLETSLKIARMDDNWNPSRGYNFGVESRQGFRRQLNSTRSSSTIRLDVTKIELARPIKFQGKSKSDVFGEKPVESESLVGYLRAEYKQMSGGKVLQDELPRLGGSASLRGYEEGQFTGRGVLTGSAELRYRPDRSAGYAGVFFDWGTLLQTEPSITYDRKIWYSIGLTTALQTGSGRLGLDLAWPPGEPFERSRLHFRITSWL